MTVMARPPTSTPSTSMIVSFSFTSRETSLKGCETRRASATPASMAKSSGSTAPVLPTTATTRRSVPEMGCGVSPRERTFSTTASKSAWVAWGFMAMNMATPRRGAPAARFRNQARRGGPRRRR